MREFPHLIDGEAMGDGVADAAPSRPYSPQEQPQRG